MANVCPECEVGKHGNCDGRAYDLIEDEIVDCACAGHGHKCRPHEDFHTLPHVNCILR